jgi:hypothetical protein
MGLVAAARLAGFLKVRREGHAGRTPKEGCSIDFAPPPA